MDKELKELHIFNGTEKYYDILNAKCTDGIKYLMENGYSWFVTDALVILKNKIKEPFCTVKLEVEEEMAMMIITDGDTKELYKQEYKWTDAKRNVKCFFTDNVFMLSGEY